MLMKKILVLFLLGSLSVDVAKAARIRNNKVKEAPKTCALMQKDEDLSRKNKLVLGTLRHSIIIEDSDESKSMTLVRDKGEKICQWSLEQMKSIQESNKLPDLKEFKFHIDEYKEILYPYVKKEDGSYFMMTIDFKTCSLDTQVTKEKLDLPKCEIPKKKVKSKSKKKKSKSPKKT